MLLPSRAVISHPNQPLPCIPLYLCLLHWQHKFYQIHTPKVLLTYWSLFEIWQYLDIMSLWDDPWYNYVWYCSKLDWTNIFVRVAYLYKTGQLRIQMLGWFRKFKNIKFVSWSHTENRIVKRLTSNCLNCINPVDNSTIQNVSSNMFATDIVPYFIVGCCSIVCLSCGYRISQYRYVVQYTYNRIMY